uniref:Uncharacterized protein n=1 Tax=Pavo cristatus TaxID=9049 RepID=A0A8C9LDF1_PAVCR
MFPFQGVLRLVFQIYDFEFLNAIGVSCFGECQNEPGSKFVTWKHLRISDALQDAGIGFILVIDRRQDKWTSVKASILRIA